MSDKISDAEFDEHLERVYEAWEAGHDTCVIANLCGITEAKADYILQCYLEGKFDQMEEARMALRRYRKIFKPEEYVL